MGSTDSKEPKALSGDVLHETVSYHGILLEALVANQIRSQLNRSSVVTCNPFLLPITSQVREDASCNLQTDSERNALPYKVDGCFRVFHVIPRSSFACFDNDKGAQSNLLIECKGHPKSGFLLGRSAGNRSQQHRIRWELDQDPHIEFAYSIPVVDLAEFFLGNKENGQHPPFKSSGDSNQKVFKARLQLEAAFNAFLKPKMMAWWIVKAS